MTTSVTGTSESPTGPQLKPTVPSGSESCKTGSKTQVHTGNQSASSESSTPADQQMQPSRSDDLHNFHSNRITANDSTCQSQEACHVAPLWITLAGKYERLVIKSPTFKVNVGRCVGTCSFNRHGAKAYKRSLRAIVLKKKIRQNNFGGCVPTKADNITVDVRYNRKTMDHVLQGFIVKECGCVV